MSIDIFLANTTKGFEKRVELFTQISQIIYDVLYEEKEINFDFELVFEAWFNQVGFLGEDLDSLKILFFVINNQDRFKAYHFKAAQGTLDDEKWLQYWEILSNDEALILHQIVNG